MAEVLRKGWESIRRRADQVNFEGATRILAGIVGNGKSTYAERREARKKYERHSGNKTQSSSTEVGTSSQTKV